jgi:hypothetical protein
LIFLNAQWTVKVLMNLGMKINVNRYVWENWLALLGSESMHRTCHAYKDFTGIEKITYTIKDVREIKSK